MWAMFLLSLLWDISDIFFTMQLTREPLKNGQPLTTESKDPNGSLLNGLKSKKARISVSLPPRRSYFQSMHNVNIVPGIRFVGIGSDSQRFRRET
jgi:hypothetical protein